VLLTFAISVRTFSPFVLHEHITSVCTVGAIFLRPILRYVCGTQKYVWTNRTFIHTFTVPTPYLFIEFITQRNKNTALFFLFAVLAFRCSFLLSLVYCRCFFHSCACFLFCRCASSLFLVSILAFLSSHFFSSLLSHRSSCYFFSRRCPCYLFSSIFSLFLFNFFVAFHSQWYSLYSLLSLSIFHYSYLTFAK